MKLVIIYNEMRDPCRDTATELAEYLYARDVELMTCGNNCGYMLKDLDGVDFSGCDAGIVLGGDGTLLASVRALSPGGVPLFGVNMGRVGFLSSVERDNLFSAVDQLLQGDYMIRERLIIQGEVLREEKLQGTYTAFNDLTVGDGVYSRAISFDLSVDGQPINSYNADGVIVSTPTGSTGYSLSAGGPILMENMDMTLITPVCPHTFFSRPIVAGADSKIRILCKTVASLTADGQFRVVMEKGDQVLIYSAPYKAKIIQFGPDDYFERIKNKLYRNI